MIDDIYFMFLCFCVLLIVAGMCKKCSTKCKYELSPNLLLVIINNIVRIIELWCEIRHDAKTMYCQERIQDLLYLKTILTMLPHYTSK